jgi:xylulokinase
MSTGHSYLVGIDLGTSSCKAMALSPGSATLAEVESAYPTAMPEPGWAEQDPASWWTAVRSSVAQLADRVPPGSQALGIGVTGQMHGLVALDASHEVIRPSILWSDQRSLEEARQITARVGEATLVRITRNPSRPAFTASKIKWLQEHEPEAARRLRHVLLPKDWVVSRLTNRLVTEPSDASGTGLFDLMQGTWAPELLSALGIDGRLLPEVVGSTTVVGHLGAGPAAELQLPAGLPVIAGAGDQAAAAYDVGAVVPGVVACNLGTSAVLTESVAQPVEGTLCHVVPGHWLYLTSAHSGTLAVDWWARTAGLGNAAQLVGLAGQSPPGARGARFVPLLVGTRDPSTDAAPQRGTFLGLRADHGAPDLARAVVEGVALEIGRIAGSLPSPTSGSGSCWRVFGGGARARLLVQVLADVLQVELQLVPGASSARGAARLVGRSLGLALPPSVEVDGTSIVTPGEGPGHGALLSEYLGDIAATARYLADLALGLSQQDVGQPAAIAPSTGADVPPQRAPEPSPTQ